MKVLVIHGPNLDALGTRAPEIYGTQTLDQINAYIEEVAADLGMSVEIHQTAREAEIISLLTDGAGIFDGAVLNPAALSHTSHAIADAIKGAPYPVVEVHLTNIHGREQWRRRSVTAESAVGLVAGFKADSYALALDALRRLTADGP
ncbi:MAG: 3-dehydroquinate dehydratase [Actinomycetota bacterium]|nr:3-dehydroquinate dehydratase [Actinomycetota bacterium]